MARPGLMANVKFKLLCRKLALPRPYVRGLLEVMWDVAHESGNPVLGDQDAVEAAAEWPGERGIFFAALRDCRLIDQRDDGAWEIHDYWHHAPEYVKGRTQRELERQKGKTCAHCGVVFHSPDARAEYCKPACRVAACRARKADPVTERNGEVRYSNGLLTDCNTTPSPSPSPINTPLPPKGGKRKKRTDNPECEAAAEEVVAYYQATVKPKHGAEGAVNNIVGLLRKGMTPERLRACTDNYAAACRVKSTEPPYRMKARNFFGKDAGYKAYLDCQPGAGGKGRDIDAEAQAMREKVTREEEEAKNGGGLLALAAAAKANGTGGHP